MKSFFSAITIKTRTVKEQLGVTPFAEGRHKVIDVRTTGPEVPRDGTVVLFTQYINTCNLTPLSKHAQ